MFAYKYWNSLSPVPVAVNGPWHVSVNVTDNNPECVCLFQSQSVHRHPPEPQEKTRDPEKWVAMFRLFQSLFAIYVCVRLGVTVMWPVIGWAEAEAELAALEELRLSRAMAYVSINPSTVGETHTHTHTG